jgi:hypothetical protein
MVERELEDRVMPEAVGVVAVLVAAAIISMRKRRWRRGMLDPLGGRGSSHASGKPVGEAKPALHLAARPRPPAREGREVPAVEAGHERLAPRDRDRPGSGGVASTVIGMVSGDRRFLGRSRNPT